MRRVKQIDTRTQNWAAGTTTLPIGFQDFWITGMDLTFTLYIVDSGGAAPYQDWLARAVTSVIINDGGRQYLMANGTKDIRPLYWGNRMRLQGRARMPDHISGSKQYQWTIPILFSPEPVVYDDQLNFWDSRVGIRPSAGLNMQIVFGAATTPGNTLTITTSGNYCLWQVTYYGIIPEPGDTPPQFYPNWQTSLFTPPSTGQGLQVANQINPGPFYRRTHQMITLGAQDGSSDVRSTGATYSSGSQTLTGISEVGIQTADNRHPIYQKLWEKSRESQSQFEVADDNSVAIAFGAASTAYATSTVNASWNVGVFHDDWSRYLAGADPVFGFNSAGKANNWLSTAYTVDTTANTPYVSLFHEAYMPY